MNILQRLIDKIRQSLRKFIRLPPVDIDTLPDLKDDPQLKEIFDNMPNPIHNTEQRLSKSPFGDLSYEEGLKHDSLITRATTANHVIGAYTTGTSISDDLVMEAVYVTMEGLNLTVQDAVNYKCLVDEARSAFINQNERELEKVFDKQSKLMGKLIDKTHHRLYNPMQHHKRKK
jgi:hypothetical protein